MAGVVGGDRDDTIECCGIELGGCSFVPRCADDDDVVGDGIGHGIGQRLGPGSTPEREVDDVGTLIDRPGDAFGGGRPWHPAGGVADLHRKDRALGTGSGNTGLVVGRSGESGDPAAVSGRVDGRIPVDEADAVEAAVAEVGAVVDSRVQDGDRDVEVTGRGVPRRCEPVGRDRPLVGCVRIRRHGVDPCVPVRLDCGAVSRIHEHLDEPAEVGFHDLERRRFALDHVLSHDHLDGDRAVRQWRRSSSRAADVDGRSYQCDGERRRDRGTHSPDNGPRQGLLNASETVVSGAGDQGAGRHPDRHRSRVTGAEPAVPVGTVSR